MMIGYMTTSQAPIVVTTDTDITGGPINMVTTSINNVRPTTAIANSFTESSSLTEPGKGECGAFYL